MGITLESNHKYTHKQNSPKHFSLSIAKQAKKINMETKNRIEIYKTLIHLLIMSTVFFF